MVRWHFKIILPHGKKEIYHFWAYDKLSAYAILAKKFPTAIKFERFDDEEEERIAKKCN